MLNELRKERPKTIDYMMEDASLSADAQSYAENITAAWKCEPSWNFYHSEYCEEENVEIKFYLDPCYSIIEILFYLVVIL